MKFRYSELLLEEVACTSKKCGYLPRLGAFSAHAQELNLELKLGAVGWDLLLALCAVAEGGRDEDAALTASFHAHDCIGECLGWFRSRLAGEEAPAGIGGDGSGGIQFAGGAEGEWLGEHSVCTQQSGRASGDGIYFAEDAVKVDCDGVAGGNGRGLCALYHIIVF